MSVNRNDNNNQNFSLQNIIPKGGFTSDSSPEKLDEILSRLEKAIKKVDLLSSVNENNRRNYEEIKPTSPLSIFWNTSLKLLEELREKSLEAENIHFEELTEIFIESICFQQDILLNSIYFKKPGKEDMKKLLSILQNLIKRLEKILILEPNLSLEVELIQKGMNILTWMFDTFKCKLIVNNSYNIVTQISNKIVTQGIKTYIDWANIFMKLMREIVKFVNNYHENGLNWFTQGNNNIYNLILDIGNTYKKYFKNYSRIFQDESSLNQIEENDKKYKIYEGVMSSIKEKELKSKKTLENDKENGNNLKKEVNPINEKEKEKEIENEKNLNNNTNNNINDNINNNKTNNNSNNSDNIQSIYDKFMEIKNASKENSNKNIKSNSNSNKDCLSISCSNSIKGTWSDTSSWVKMGVRKKLLSMGERNYYEENDNVVLYQNFDGIIKNIKSDCVGENTILKIINCLNCSFKVSKTINRIIILNCQNCKVICAELFANIEIVNNTKIIMQCDGDAKMANVEGSKDIMFILSPESKHIPIHYRNSTLIRVKTLKENCEDGNINEYDEYILPEQFEFGLNEEMKLEYDIISI